MTSNAKADELENRLIQFAIDITRLIEKLPNDRASKHISSQVLRSGTSAAPNYGEARSAESRADFVHKLKICLKELNETSVWLRILQGVVKNSAFLATLLAENTELCKIMVASIQTARRNAGVSEVK